LFLPTVASSQDESCQSEINIARDCCFDWCLPTVKSFSKKLGYIHATATIRLEKSNKVQKNLS
jgi:hypothetical protein